MEELFGPEWAGEPFQLFGTSHLVMLGTLAVLAVALVVWGRTLRERGRRILRWVLVAVMGLNILGWHAWRWSIGTWTVQEVLPLHLCSVLGPVTIIALLTRNTTAANLSWLLGVPGALQALITPEVAPYGFPHYRVVNSWLVHGAIVLSGVWLVFVEGLRPTLRWVIRCFLLLNLYAVAVYFINAQLGSNYLYVNHKPEFASVLDLLPAWPWYLLVLEALLIAFMLLFWLIGRTWGAKRRRG